MSMIKTRLKDFKLSGIYNSYEDRIKYAQEKSLSYEEFLEMLLEDEENNRKDVDSASNLPGNPAQTCHPFRVKPAT